MSVKIRLDTSKDKGSVIEWEDINFGDVVLTISDGIVMKMYDGWVSLKNPASTWKIAAIFSGSVIGKLVVEVGPE